MATFIKTGYWIRQQQGYDNWLNLDLLIKKFITETAITEAPKDGQIYGRQNGAWVVAGGSGGTQDLEQTLSNGNTSEISIQLFDNLEFPNASHTITYDASILQDITTNFLIGFDSNTHSFVSTKYDTNERILLKYDKIEFLTLGGTNTIKPSTFNSNTTFTLPGKATGDYILATTDDIPSSTASTLEQVLTAGNSTTKVMNFSTSGGNTTGAIDYNGLGFDNVSEQTRISLDPTDPQIKIEDLTTGTLFIARKDRITFAKGGFNTHLTIATPIGNTFINMPVRTSGTYTLATEDQINLQGVLNINGRADFNKTDPDFENTYQSISLFETNPSAFIIETGASETPNRSSSIEGDLYSIAMFNRLNPIQSRIEIFEGKIKLQELVQAVGQTTVTFEEVTGAAFIVIPNTSGTVALKEQTLLRADLDKFQANVVFDGTSTVYRIPHSFGSEIDFADAIRGAGTNFDVYNVTWDDNDVILTYQNPPVASTQSFNVRIEKTSF